MTDDHIPPVWAPRVSQWKIRRLYEDDAQGLHDDELLDEVGYGLLSRCQSFIAAVEAVHGRAVCPRCGGIVEHGVNKEETLRCDGCGWNLPWADYFATIQHKQLSGAEAVLELFGEYLRAFPQARTWQEKMLAIDVLIHGFHWYHKTGLARPTAVNLIEGRLDDVIAFLDGLTYGKASTPGVRDGQAAWRERIRLIPWLHLPDES